MHAETHGLKVIALRLAALAAGFLGDRHGGAMLVALAFVLVAMAGAGSALVNLSWQELHREQIRNAGRAAVAAAGATLLHQAGANVTVDLKISEKVKNFIEAAVTSASVDYVTVHEDNGRVAVDVTGVNAVPPLWGRGGGQPFAESVAVRLETARHEIAFALDVSRSMKGTFGVSSTRMEALQDAIGDIEANLLNAQSQSRADLMVAMVPFSAAVRVADTSGTGETAGKRRYVKLLGGALKAKWVDVYHHYGINGTHEKSLPSGWDWDQDIWNGCVMARWGAYWNPLAGTPPQWPATLNGEPLHLSDAPPDHNNPHTLFTAYSWPDAESGGSIDANIQFAMAGLTPSNTWRGDNSWSLVDGGGNAMCPDGALVPLTDQIGSFVTAVNALQPISESLGQLKSSLGRNTNLYLTSVISTKHAHQGIVWGVRALSPHWRDIWKTTDSLGASRPAAYGDVRKTILIVIDGENLTPAVRGAQRPLQNASTPIKNPVFYHHQDCIGGGGTIPSEYHTLAQKTDDELNQHFDGKTWREDLAKALGVPTSGVPAFKADLAAYQPADVFRNIDGGLSDLLVNHGLPRPRHTRRHLCDWWSAFTPYGRIGDPLYVGGEPVFGESPLPPMDVLRSIYDPTADPASNDWRRLPRARIDEWFAGACDIAAARGIRVHAIYIGKTDGLRQPFKDMLNRCVTPTGGKMLDAPNSTEFKAAMAKLVERELMLSFTD